MGRRKAGERVLGPHRDGDGWRVVTVDGAGARRGLYYATIGEARRAIARLSEAVAGLGTRTVGEAIEAYQAQQTCKPSTAKDNAWRLRRFFGDETAPLRSLTPARCVALYEAIAAEMAVDSHRNILNGAKTFLRWCVTRGWLASSPAEKLVGVGRRKRGKPQLRIDEARHWVSLAMAYAEAGEAGAVAALLTLYLNLRSSEIVGLRVRDIDDAGRLLWVADSKTDAGRRTLEIPEPLRPFLVELARGQDGAALLFGPHWRDWPRLWVQRICRESGVPKVSAHGMRGLHASLAVAAGLSPGVVASAMGHASSSVTLGHYATGESAGRGAQATALRVLQGGRRC